jgi:exopolyphosphatase/guanosine-5'-triphosphate,3'-diphosphate pyrophosphatase
MRLQAIDIGTNSVRSLIVEPRDDGSFRVIDDEKETTRLGVGLAATGQMSQSSMDNTVLALRAFLGIGRDLQVDRVRAIATAAMRTASNGAAFAARLRDEIGLEVEIVSEAQEGRLVFLSASAHFDLPGHCAVVDIGGGSVEVVTAQDGEIEHIASMPIGVRVLSETFVDADPISSVGFKAMKRHVRKTLRASVGNFGVASVKLVGSGGTVTSVASMITAAQGMKRESAHGIEIARPELMLLLSDLSRSTVVDRRRMPGLSEERVDVILAGTLILAEVMKLTGASSVFVNARGIREGIVIDTLRSAHGDIPLDRMAAVLAFGARCHYDERHAEQVRRLALSLFDQLSGELALDPTGRELLETAALLHDIGYHIAYDRHHRHSHHLVTHSRLPGFTNREIRRIASIARYHTKALPKETHEAWLTLDPQDRDAVAPLAALLRLADALDRGRASRLDEVRATFAGEELVLVLEGSGDLHPELFALEKKKDLFEGVFGITVSAVVDGDDTSLI